MEVKFHTNTCPCLKKAVSQVQNQEQTQEVRLPESMPDIGNVLGAWGQVLIRGKEWRTGEMSINGGVLAWVLYAPDDGSEIRSVETWIPFQMKWDLPQTQRDGSICAVPLLKGVDARSTSARKLIVRASVGVLAEAFEPIEPEICCPGQIPEDVQLLKKCYPAELPVEAGEKLFEIDEDLVMPENLPRVNRILCYSLTPEVVEQKVMVGRLVFRGKSHLHLLYTDEEGEIHSWDHEISFSQFTDLDKDHSTNAKAWISVINTGAEMELREDGKINLKAGMAAQYVIYDRMMLELIEDAYSPHRNVEVQMQPWNGLTRLEERRESLQIEHTMQIEGSRAVDVSFLSEHPVCRQNGEVAQIAAAGQFQLLYYDADDNLRSAVCRGETMCQIPSDSNNWICSYLQPDTQVQVQFGADSVTLRAGLVMETSVFAEGMLQMVSAMEVGEKRETDEERPSLIIRRKEDAGLWDMAKACGSTVDAIKKANAIEDEPEHGRMLLIPVS